MTKLLNHINTYADLTAYNNDMEKDFSNISYIKGSDEVKWNKYDPDHIVCVYNVTSTSEETKLLHRNFYISYQIIDGVKQDTVQMNYTFDTLGKHTVKYKLSGTSIGDYTFQTCKSLTSITIPSGVKSIGMCVFENCTSLASIIIPDSVTTIDINALRDTSLASIIIPDSVTTIGNFAIYNCKGLKSVTIGNGITSIDMYAFNNCTGLTSITIKATTPPTLGSNTFTNTNNCPIYVPAESVDAYKQAENWVTYADRIQPIS